MQETPQALQGPLLGAHMSIAGGVHEALYRAQQAGCEAVQVFTRPSRQWSAPPLHDNEITIPTSSTWHLPISRSGKSPCMP
jgi:deoxyribonuclease-4